MQQSWRMENSMWNFKGRIRGPWGRLTIMVELWKWCNLLCRPLMPSHSQLAWRLCWVCQRAPAPLLLLANRVSESQNNASSADTTNPRDKTNRCPREELAEEQTRTERNYEEMRLGCNKWMTLACATTTTKKQQQRTRTRRRKTTTVYYYHYYHYEYYLPLLGIFGAFLCAPVFCTSHVRHWILDYWLHLPHSSFNNNAKQKHT